MNTVFWIAQGLLAFIMLMAGFLKLTSSKPDLIKKGNGRMDWAEDVSSASLKLIGLVELLAGIGLILPQWLGIMPILTPLAAVGVILTMIGALALHLKRKDEPKSLAINIFILLIAAFVAFGRF